MNLLITQPCASTGTSVESAKKYVSEKNAEILLCAEFPTCAEFFTPRMLLGDPNSAFSESIAEMLAETGILTRTAVLDENGRQRSINLGKPSQLWHYAWLSEDFSALDEAKLLSVGWDIRRVPGFYNVVTVSDVVEQEETPEEDVTDNVPSPRRRSTEDPSFTFAPDEEEETHELEHTLTEEEDEDDETCE